MKFLRKLEKFIKGQKGQATISAAMILLLIGGILIPPCLGFAVASLKASQSGEQVLEGRYAADAGVEDAIWNITYANLTTPANYTLAEEVNNRITNVSVTNVSGGGHSGYKIISTATSNSGGNTTIECYYGALDYSSLLDHAITSNDTVCVKGDVDPNDSVVARNCACEQHGFNYTNCTRFDELVEPIFWPTEELLSTWYSDDVNKSAPYSEDHIDIAEDEERGPLYADGELDIYNSGDAGKNATLNGTVYVKGDTEIGKPTGIGTARNFTLNLNNETIFVESNSTGSGNEALKITDAVTITGSGCIIAVGDVYFAPKGDVGSDEGDFVFIMSIEGTVTLQPGGDFYGAVAGNAEVEMKSGNTLYWISDGEGIDFPRGQGVARVLSYTIK